MIAIVSLLELHIVDRNLDLGCDIGVHTRMIADRQVTRTIAVSVSIDAAVRVIQLARKK